MQLVLADDFAMVRENYRKVIEHTKNMNIHARWIYGKHPTDVMIQSYIDRQGEYHRVNKRRREDGKHI